MVKVACRVDRLLTFLLRRFAERSVSARNSPRRSRRRSQLARRSRSSVRRFAAPGSRCGRCARGRPSPSAPGRSIRAPARCCTTAESDMSSGLASSLTDAGPRHSRSTMIRRVGSASAWKTRSSGADGPQNGQALTEKELHVWLRLLERPGIARPGFVSRSKYPLSCRPRRRRARGFPRRTRPVPAAQSAMVKSSPAGPGPARHASSIMS